LALAFGPEYLDRELRVDALQKGEPFARESFVETDGVLGDQFEVAAVPAARLAGGVTLIEDNDATSPGRLRAGSVIRRRGSGEPRTDDDQLRFDRQFWTRLMPRQWMAGAEPVGLIARGQGDLAGVGAGAGGQGSVPSV